MAVGIVIPVWNLWEKMTLPCLKSLVRHTSVPDIRVYLVDNASTDNTACHAETIGISLFGREHFTYIKNSQNMGFAVACNQGARQAEKDGCEYVLFLNNDTVVTPNWLPPLVKALDNPRVGMAGPLLLYPDKTVQHCGVVFTPLKRVGHIYSDFPVDHYTILKKRKFRVITGAVLLCRTEQFFAFGGFYEEYKNGMEDIDLCYTYAEHGLMQQVVPESVVYHYTSQTPGRLDAQTGYNNGRLLYVRKPDIVPDAHLYYHQDGYVPAFTEDFVFYVRLREKQRQEINRAVFSAYSDELCKEYLLKEPFWHDGYQALIASLVKQGKAADALSYCRTALNFCFCRHTARQYVKIAAMVYDEKTFNTVKLSVTEKVEFLETSRAENKAAFERIMGGDSWHDRLLATRALDIGEICI